MRHGCWRLRSGRRGTGEAEPQHGHVVHHDGVLPVVERTVVPAHAVATLVVIPAALGHLGRGMKRGGSRVASPGQHGGLPASGAVIRVSVGPLGSLGGGLGRGGTARRSRRVRLTASATIVTRALIRRCRRLFSARPVARSVRGAGPRSGGGGRGRSRPGAAAGVGSFPSARRAPGPVVRRAPTAAAVAVPSAVVASAAAAVVGSTSPVPRETTTRSALVLSAPAARPVSTTPRRAAGSTPGLAVPAPRCLLLLFRSPILFPWATLALCGRCRHGCVRHLPRRAGRFRAGGNLSVGRQCGERGCHQGCHLCQGRCVGGKRRLRGSGQRRWGSRRGRGRRRGLRLSRGGPGRPTVQVRLGGEGFEQHVNKWFCFLLKEDVELV